MNWTELLNAEIAGTFHATEGLLALVEDEALGWKPQSGENWMTTGQLLKHIPTSCGFCMRGFVTGDWGMPEGQSFAELSPEEMMPSADKMPTSETVAQCREELAADHALALAMVAEAGEDRLSSETLPAPWDPTPMLLGHRMLEMVAHLAQHKTQLFYYLKLQGKPVNTYLLYGMQP